MRPARNTSSRSATAPRRSARAARSRPSRSGPAILISFQSCQSSLVSGVRLMTMPRIGPVRLVHHELHRIGRPSQLDSQHGCRRPARENRLGRGEERRPLASPLVGKPHTGGQIHITEQPADPWAAQLFLGHNAGCQRLGSAEHPRQVHQPHPSSHAVIITHPPPLNAHSGRYNTNLSTPHPTIPNHPTSDLTSGASAFSRLSGVNEVRITPLSPLNAEERSVGDR